MSYNHLKVIRGVLNRIYCCYDNFLYRENDHNLLIDVKAFLL